jgi:hypothetical protein
MLNGVWYRDRELQTECGKLSVDRDRELAAKWLPQLAKWDPKKKWFGTQSEFNEAMMFARKPQRWICFLLEMYYGKPHVPHHYSIFNCTREQALAIASMKRRESKAKWKACNGKKNMVSATK